MFKSIGFFIYFIVVFWSIYSFFFKDFFVVNVAVSVIFTVVVVVFSIWSFILYINVVRVF